MLITKIAEKVRNKVSPIKFGIIEKYSSIRYESTHRHINPQKSYNNNLRLNLIVPTINDVDVFGGIATALNILIRCYQEMNCEARIIALNKYDKLSTSLPDEFKNKEIGEFSVNIIGIDKTDLEIRSCDYFIATYWSTALLAEEILQWQESVYGMRPLLFYLLQDYEPGFYPWSTEYVESERTYRLDIDTVAIFNSSYLKKYFDNKNYHFYKTVVFEPVLNDQLKQYLIKHSEKGFIRKKQIIVYGRPQEYRNAFTLLVDSLKIFSDMMGNEASDWKVISLGAKHKNVRLNNEMIIQSKGKVSIEEYAKIMSESYAGIALMISPHPSYPPLEMSTFGVKTITNTFENKDLKSFNENIFSIYKYNAMCIAQELYRIVREYNSVSSNICLESEYIVSNNEIEKVINELHSILREWI